MEYSLFRNGLFVQASPKVLQDIYENVDLVLFDFDGVFTHYTPEHHAHCDHTVAAAALSFMEGTLRIKAPFDESSAACLARKSYEKHRWSFIEFCYMYGLNPKTLHEIYHDLLDPGTIKDMQVFARHLLNFPKKFAILSHAHQTWINRLLIKHGLKEQVSDDQIFSWEKVGYKLKSSEDSYKTVLDKYGVSPSLALMIEDCLENLEVANAIGMRTIHISCDSEKNASEGCSYIDYTTSVLSHFCEEFSRCEESVRCQAKANGVNRPSLLQNAGLA